ncbi:MAG: glycosyltransferase [Methanosarcinales archaeon]
MEELVEKIHYFLAHSEQRESIAQMGWKRAISDHTWERRFEKIFRLAGLFH